MSDSYPLTERLRFIEFFAGIGGFAACCEDHEIVAAIDIDQAAKKVYQFNFSHAYYNKSLESIGPDWLETLGANAWWLSPPCQPYSQRGHRRDRKDPRSRGLENLIHLIPQVRPLWILLENVIGFAKSEMFARLEMILQQSAYEWQTLEVCPSRWGWPNRRPRFYLMATTDRLPIWRTPPSYQLKWQELITQEFSAELRVPDSFMERYGKSLDRLTSSRDGEPTACFGSSYGVASSGSGSYVEFEPGRYRRFSPEEMLRLLGFPSNFKLEAAGSLRKQWSLAGNTLSLPVVRYLMQHLPQAAGCS